MLAGTDQGGVLAFLGKKRYDDRWVVVFLTVATPVSMTDSLIALIRLMDKILHYPL